MRRLAREDQIPYDLISQIGSVTHIESWVRERLIYTVDIPVEVLRTTSNIISNIRNTGRFNGDCDDAAILVSSICMGLNIPCWIVAIKDGILDSNYSHVFVEASYEEGRLIIDPTVSQDIEIVYSSCMKVKV